MNENKEKICPKCGYDLNGWKKITDFRDDATQNPFGRTRYERRLYYCDDRKRIYPLPPGCTHVWPRYEDMRWLCE
jgi:hypothetical protein